MYLHNLPDCDKPVTRGWQFSLVAILPLLTSSWCYVLDCLRIETTTTPAQVAASQFKALTELFVQRLLVVADRYYGSAKFLTALLAEKVECDALLRVKGDRVFYRPAPPPTGGRGAPRKDGDRFKCSDPATQGLPDQSYRVEDAQGRILEVDRWDNLHFRQERRVSVSVIRMRWSGATGKKGDKRLTWFIWWGQPPLSLALVQPTYRRRFRLEHTFRFEKQDLLWEKAYLRTPAQFQLWTDLVGAVVNQLVLACPFKVGYLRPWESKQRQSSPQQVRRGLRGIIIWLGTPARMPKPRGKSPGRATGAEVKVAPQFPEVKKAAGVAKKQKKRA